MESGQLSIVLKDNGPGIPKDVQSKIFERFYRVDEARTGKKSGTGLGLAITKHILKRHNSALRLESTVGEGSVFSVHMPLYKDKSKKK